MSRRPSIRDRKREVARRTETLPVDERHYKEQDSLARMAREFAQADLARAKDRARRARGCSPVRRRRAPRRRSASGGRGRPLGAALLQREQLARFTQIRGDIPGVGRLRSVVERERGVSESDLKVHPHVHGRIEGELRKLGDVRRLCRGRVSRLGVDRQYVGERRVGEFEHEVRNPPIVDKSQRCCPSAIPRAWPAKRREVELVSVREPYALWVASKLTQVGVMGRKRPRREGEQHRHHLLQEACRPDLAQFEGDPLFFHLLIDDDETRGSV